jgi:uncharacterized protein (DUF2147 family)
MNTLCRLLAASPMLLIAAAGSALAAADPRGTWIDHTGRGAVEISDCNGALCGRIVWLKSAGDREACGMQVIGNARPVSGGRWDGGWIYDPEADRRYDVELTPIGDNKLKVFGYAGMKMFGETMMWTRAPVSLRRCDAVAEAPPAGREPPRAETEPEPAAPPVEATPERRAEAAPGGRVRQGKGPARQCAVKVDGLGQFTFPCPQ